MLKQPVGMKLLTNVAVVKLKKQGKNFELACYKNKVTDWRNKRETDVSQVLQIDQIFSNVETGLAASKAELKKFGNMSRDEIILEILNKGEFQLSQLEREDKLEQVKLDIANWISQQCVNTENQNQFPSSIILRAMKEVNCNVVHTKTAKQQAIPILNAIKAVLPIERARMNLKVTCTSTSQAEAFQKSLQQEHSDSVTIDFEKAKDNGVEVYLTIEKSIYRVVQEMLKKERELYANVSVELLDATTFQAALQFARQSQPSAEAIQQSAQAAMANLNLNEEEKKSE